MSFISTGGGILIPDRAMPKARAGVEAGTDSLGIFDQTGYAGFGGAQLDGTFGGLTGGPGGTRMSSYGEYIPDPRWASPYDLDQMVRVDGKVQAVMLALTLPIRRAKTSVQPGKGDTGQAAWCRQWIAGLPAGQTPIDLVIAQLTNAHMYSKSMFELRLDATADGRLTPTRIAWRPPHNTTLHRDPQTDLVDGLLQRLPGVVEPVMIPLDRALIYLHNPHLDPRNGCSDLLPAWCVHRLRMAIVNLWSVFLRRTATPWATAKVATSSLAEATALARRVATLRSGGVVGLGANDTVGVLDAGGSAGNHFEQAIQWCDRQITGSVLAQFLDLGQTKVGSFALSRDHSDFFTMGRVAVTTEIAAAVTSMLGRVCRLNFGQSAPCPSFAFGPLADADTDQLVDVFKALMTAPSPSPQVTGAFSHSLVLRVAGALGLDMQAIEAESRTGPAQSLAAGVEHAARMAQAIGVA